MVIVTLPVAPSVTVNEITSSLPTEIFWGLTVTSEAFLETMKFPLASEGLCPMSPA